MDEITVKYNIPIDQIVQQSQQMFYRIDELSRTSNEQQIRLLQEATDRMGTIVDSYVDRMKRSYDIMFNIMKGGWDLSYSDAKQYFEKIEGLRDQMLDSVKGKSDEEVKIQKDTINKKLDEAKKELESIKSNTDEKISQHRREFDAIREIQSAYQTVSSGINTAMGPYSGGMITSGLSIGGDILGGAGNLIGLQPGQAAKDLFNAVTKGMGVMMGVMKKVNTLKRGMLPYLGNIGEVPEDIYSGQLDIYGNEGIGGLRKQEELFAGTAELEAQNQQNIMRSIGRTRTTPDEGNMGTARQLTMLGMAKDVPVETLVNFVATMRMRFDEPVDKIVGRFGQLEAISNNLGISIQKVLQDYEQLTSANQKLGYSQETIMGLYSEYGEQIKNGTVSIGQLIDAMKGMAGLSTEQATGTVAMILSQDEGKLLGNMRGGDRQAAKMALDLLRKSQQTGGDVEAGVLAQMIANPKADFDKDPFLREMADKYGFNADEFGKMQPEMKRLALSTGTTIGQESGAGPGEGFLIMQKIMQSLGMPLQGTMQEITTQEGVTASLGTKGEVPSLTKAIESNNKAINQQEEAAKKLATWIERLEKQIESEAMKMEESMRKNFKGVTDLDGSIKALNKGLKDYTDVLFGKMGIDPKTVGRKTGEKVGETIGDYAQLAGPIGWLSKGIEKITGWSPYKSLGGALGNLGGGRMDEDSPYNNPQTVAPGYSTSEQRVLISANESASKLFNIITKVGKNK